MTEPNGQWTEVPGAKFERDHLYESQATAFLDAINGVGPIPCTLDEGVQTLKTTLAVLSSIEKGYQEKPKA